MREQKLLIRLLRGSRNVKFNDLVRIVEAFGFYHSRTTGSHHI
jgi:predicted RNA binding protein YcfA (HicA-like mRNA interferase family)